MAETPQDPKDEVAKKPIDRDSFLRDANPLDNPDMRRYLEQRAVAIEGERYRHQAKSLPLALKISGGAKPAIVMNFNPIRLQLEGGLTHKAPSVLEADAKDLFIYPFDGRHYRATVTTIDEPLIFPWPLYVRDTGKERFAVNEPHVCTPIEIAYEFKHAYATGWKQSMGGVVAFEGARDLLDFRGARNEVRVPAVVRTATKEARIVYTEYRDFDNEIQTAIAMQKAYCMAQLDEADAYWDAVEDQKPSIHNVHQIWHRYAVAMAWVSFSDRAETWVS